MVASRGSSRRQDESRKRKEKEKLLGTGTHDTGQRDLDRMDHFLDPE
jgi:hypothetical protein